MSSPYTLYSRNILANLKLIYSTKHSWSDKQNLTRPILFIILLKLVLFSTNMSWIQYLEDCLHYLINFILSKAIDSLLSLLITNTLFQH